MSVAIPSREGDEGFLKSHEGEGFQGLSAGRPTLGEVGKWIEAAE